MPSVRGFLDKYVHHNKKPEVPPPITTITAAFFLVLYTIIYVAPFYLSSRTRPSAQLSRDAPSVIRARIASVSLSCLVCSLVTFYIVTKDRTVPSVAALHLLGYWPVGLAEAWRCLLLTATLFTGPLFEHLIVEGGWRSWVRLEPLYELLTEWTTWRNIIAGPATEEVLFRSAGIPLMLLARASIAKTVFLSPVVFGLAHIHHFYEFRITHPHVPIQRAVAKSLFQFAFTTIFGAYATFLFLRTGSLLAIAVVHAFCNSMGLPRIWGRVQPATAASPSPAVPSDDKEGRRPTAAGQPKTLLWTVAYYILFVTGAVVFYKNLWILSKSVHELVPIGAKQK